MSKKLTPTLAICLAAGLAAGIGLARPANHAPAVPAPPALAANQPTDAPARAGVRLRSDPIEIIDFAYNDVVVPAGGVVEVRNVDTVAHTVTATGTFDTGNIGGSSAATFVAPSEAGTYSFTCLIHPAMHGTLTVE